MASKKAKTGTTITAENLDNYYNKRMFSMGITNPSEHHFIVAGDFPSPDYKQAIFQETEAGNITINYPSLYGGAETITGSETPFTRLRYKPENQQDPKLKYFQEKGTGVHIFFPPALIEKFKNKTPIPRLDFTEGEFKAMAGSLAGLDIIGLGGKDSFRDADKTGLHPDIIAIIRDCSTETCNLILDADTLAVKWDHETEPDKDLSKSLSGFRSTAINFREACINAGVKDSYLTHSQLNLLHTSKGLDDLLEQKRETDSVSYVIDDLARLTAAKVYFNSYNIGAMQPVAINKIFWLNPGRGGVPASFYANNSEVLKSYPFKFKGAMYQNNPETGLECIKHADSDKYIRIGCDYFKMIEIPDSNGIPQPLLEGWKAGEIMRDHGKSFFNGIEKYDAPCNVPCNTDQYQKVVNGCYNRYYPLSHQLTDGAWPIIEGALKHLFGERVLVPGEGDTPGFTSYDLIMDYLTIMYSTPTQPLPIVVLYSLEGNTGKSTGIWLLEDIFLANYTEVTNDIFEDNMNDDWATKLAIGMDEGFIEKNKVYQKIKSLSTAHKIMMRGMYSGRKSVPFFGKIWITTNDKNFIKLEKNETRFWINEVPVLQKIDPDIRGKMQNEIPAFLYHLANRELKYPKVSRHWFAPELLITDMGNQVKESSKGWFEKEVNALMLELFYQYMWHTLYFTNKEITDLLNTNSAFKSRKADVRDQLKVRFGIEDDYQRWQQPNLPEDRNPMTATHLKHATCYPFKIEQFISADKIKAHFNKHFDYDTVILSRLKPVVTQDEDDMPF